MAKHYMTTEKNLELVKDMVSQGHAVGWACKKVGIGRSAFYRKMNTDGAFKKEYHEAIDARVLDIEDSLYKQGMSGNVTAIIFFLTNRASDRWKHKAELEHNIKEEKDRALCDLTKELAPLQEKFGIINSPQKFNNQN